MADIVLYEGINELNVSLAPIVANLYGVVTDAYTALPIAGVKVTIDGLVTYTDSSGAYGFKGLDLGIYSISFVAVGYPILIRSILLHKGDNKRDITLSAVPGILYGVITDSKTGQPIQGVQVTIDGINVYTDASGQYTFDKIALGSYILAVMKTGYEPPDVMEITITDEPQEINFSLKPLASYPISADFPTPVNQAEQISVSHTVHLEYRSDYIYTIALYVGSFQIAYAKFVSADLQAMGGIFRNMLPMSYTGDYTFTDIAQFVYCRPGFGGREFCFIVSPGIYTVWSIAKLQVISEIKYDEYGRPYGLSYSAESTIWEDIPMGEMEVTTEYTCIYCGDKFTTEAGFGNHLKTSHPGKPGLFTIYPERTEVDGGDRLLIAYKIYIPTVPGGYVTDGYYTDKYEFAVYIPGVGIPLAKHWNYTSAVLSFIGGTTGGRERIYDSSRWPYAGVMRLFWSIDPDIPLAPGTYPLYSMCYHAIYNIEEHRWEIKEYFWKDVDTGRTITVV